MRKGADGMSEKSGRETVIFESAEALSRDAAHRFVSLAAQRTRVGERFSVALAGGSTPKMLYELLASPMFRQAVDWEQVHIFFGDERAVPHDHPDSNFRMAHSALLSQVAIPAANIHPIQADAPDLEAAARSYTETLRAEFNLTDDRPFPRFDLILLGMGPDGHTASLFPGKPSLQEKARLIVVSEPGLPPFVPRLTFTYPVLNSAANVLFLVTGADKAGTLSRMLTGPLDGESLPSQQVAPTDGTLAWLVDRAAMAIGV